MMTGTVSERGDVRVIAFYLPQFHRIEENDRWWGKGFTEWTNVTKAVPLFVGHYQPHLPTDLGFYDLRLREARREQIRLAKRSGIDGFCYHYYWFSGTRLLEAPLDDMLADPGSDMPFCLCWANENWTRRWDGAEQEILIAQQYRPEDDIAFIEDLMPFLQDPRYIRIDGAPLLIVYRPQHLPDSRKSVATWRRYCAENGIARLHVACALTHGNWDHAAYGFDSGVEFPPHNISGENQAHDLRFFSRFGGHCLDYTMLADRYLERRYGPEWSGFRSVLPSWDNTARRGDNAVVFLNGTPENYEYWLSEAIRKTREEFPGSDRVVFVNAWNEWAEGCHLEPDRRYGHAFLEATVRARAGTGLKGWTHVGIPDECRRPTPRTTFFRVRRPKRRTLIGRTWRRIRDRMRGGIAG